MTASASSGVCLRSSRRRVQLKKAWPSTTPTRIMTGAAEMPIRLNGAAGRAKNRPQALRLLKPKLIRMIAEAASTTPTPSILTSGRPWSGLSLKLSANTTAATATSRPNTGRQPM